MVLFVKKSNQLQVTVLPKTLKNRQEELQAEIDQIEMDLKADMEIRGVDEMRAGPFTVIWKMIHSTRFDSKRCKAENPQIYNLYAVSSSYRKFSVV